MANWCPSLPRGHPQGMPLLYTSKPGRPFKEIWILLGGLLCLPRDRNLCIPDIFSSRPLTPYMAQIHEGSSVALDFRIFVDWRHHQTF